MNDNFAEILKTTRELENDRHWLNKSFEGALFEDSGSWMLANIDVEMLKTSESKEVTPVAPKSTPKAENKAPEVSIAPTVPTKPETKLKPSAPQTPKFDIFLEDEKSKEKKDLGVIKAKNFSSFDEYLKEMNPSWSTETIASFSEFSEQEGVDILFYGEKQILDFSTEDFPGIGLFNTDRDLLGKMIQAMNIPNGRFVRSSIHGQGDEALQRLGYEVEFFKPKIIMTLGASSLNLLLGKKQRLSQVHGQFFSKGFKLAEGEREVKFSPIFHPDFLEINPSMKRTAWLDMQKVMNFLQES